MTDTNERQRVAKCGCHYDAPSGLITHFCDTPATCDFSQERRPTCPECGSPMQKAGTVMSGRHAVPCWRCSNKQCGRRSMKPVWKEAAK